MSGKLKFISALFFVLSFVLMFSAARVTSAASFTILSPAEARAMISRNPDVIVVDVRSNIDYCYYGHIPCAINLSWNSGEYEREYQQLPVDAPIINVCEHGSRGASASAFLSSRGYTEVYNISGGMTAWNSAGYEKITCADENPDDCQPREKLLYYPHIASDKLWETEIAVVNLDPENGISVNFQAYDKNGTPVGTTRTVKLAPAGRRELIVGRDFSRPEDISYIILDSQSAKLAGYLKFFNASGGIFRAAIPAVAETSLQPLSISQIAVDDGWWTGIALLNTTASDRNLTITFNTGLVISFNLAAGAYKSINLADLISPAPTTGINSAVIEGAEGVVGLEIFGCGNQLAGITLKDTTETTLYYPYITDDPRWWTGMAVFNPGKTGGVFAIKAYAADGTELEIPSHTSVSGPRDRQLSFDPGTFFIRDREQFIGTLEKFDLPAGTAWMSLTCSVPVTGFELFGTSDGKQLAGYTSVALEGTSGVLEKLEDQGWTGIALVNTAAKPIAVTLKAYANSGGDPVATTTVPLNPHERVVKTPEKLFSADLGDSTYIGFTATAPVVAFQLNGSGMALDALPGSH